MSTKTQQADLYLLGAGVGFPHQLTIETVDILANCKRICTNLSEERLPQLPVAMREKCMSLRPLYQNGRRRQDNYDDVTQAVVSEVASAGSAAWLTQGHPTVFDSVSKSLWEEAKNRNWIVSILPAISSIDTLLAHVPYDPADGLIIHDATALVHRRVALTPSMAVILLQVSAFQTDRAQFTLESARIDLLPLRDYLMQFYSHPHRCAMIRSPSTQGQPPDITWFELSDLALLPVESIVNANLFIPRIT